MTPHIDNGGPAFPTTHGRANGDGTFAQNQIEVGMTLRDYFAAKAMQGMLANQHPYQASDEHMFARDAYVVADAMLKARSA